jgi:hypothetical protein
MAFYATCRVDLARAGGFLGRDPEKRRPVFRKIMLELNDAAGAGFNFS